jgi:hypothetical protein
VVGHSQLLQKPVNLNLKNLDLEAAGKVEPQMTADLSAKLWEITANIMSIGPYCRPSHVVVHQTGSIGGAVQSVFRLVAAREPHVDGPS